MSSKRNKSNKDDNFFMDQALSLASQNLGLTGENPSVGCVLIKGNQTISVGVTGINGKPHAEVNAIKNSKEKVKGSTLYVTLEPCNHYGKTPPCTKNIIKNKISEVYYSIDDIDVKVKGKSYSILKKNNINVKKGLLKKESLNLYESYYLNRKKKLPYVIGKIALSKNKIIYSDVSKKITNNISDKLTHYLRLKCDGIMITSETLNIDNPKLSCRLEGYAQHSPKWIILDKNLKIDLKSYVVKSIKNGNTIIFYNSNNRIKKNFLTKKGAFLINQPIQKHKNFDLKKILKKLYMVGIKNLLVEGGDKLTKSFLQKRMFNEFYMFKSSKNLLKENKYVNFTSSYILNTKYDRYKTNFKLGTDKITIYKR